MLENNFESPLDSREFKLVNPKRNEPWIFIGRTDAETEAPIPWPPDAKNWLIGKDPDAGEDRRQEEKGTAGDEMVEWHHLFSGHEFEQTLGDSEGQGSLECCSPWGHKELDMTEQLNNNNIKPFLCSVLLLLLLSCFSSVWLCAAPWTAADQAPPSLGFSRQEHWSGFLFHCPTHESEKWKQSHSVVSDS